MGAAPSATPDDGREGAALVVGVSSLAAAMAREEMILFLNAWKRAVRSDRLIGSAGV